MRRCGGVDGQSGLPAWRLVAASLMVQIFPWWVRGTIALYTRPTFGLSERLHDHRRPSRLLLKTLIGIAKAP